MNTLSTVSVCLWYEFGEVPSVLKDTFMKQPAKHNARQPSIGAGRTPPILPSEKRQVVVDSPQELVQFR